MVKIKKLYTIKQIRSYYVDIIKKGIKQGIFKHEGEALKYISVINSKGIDITEYNKVLFLLEKIVEVKNNKIDDIYDKDYYLGKIDNQTLVYILINNYFSDNNIKYDYNNDEKYRIRVLKRI